MKNLAEINYLLLSYGEKVMAKTIFTMTAVRHLEF